MESVAYEELLQKDGRIMTHVVGNSMLPLLRDRESIVIVETTEHVKPRRGDVVLFKTGEKYILHRILQDKQDEYLIRGDNTWTMEYVPKDAILAVMTGFYRKPESKLISRDNFSYRTYQVLLTGIRWSRRIMRGIKERIQNIRRFVDYNDK